MPHLAEGFRAVQLRHFLRKKDTWRKAWALVDDQGYIREMSPAFHSCLQTHWPDWHGNLLPKTLANCVLEGDTYKTRSIVIKIKKSKHLRFLELVETSILDRLSARESEIISRYANGETYSAIAGSLALSPATVRNHISHCYKKLDVNNKAELANLLTNKKQRE